MYISHFALAAFYAAIAIVNAIATPKLDYSFPKTPKLEQLAGRRYNASSEGSNNYNATHGLPRCKPEDVVYRREWRTLSIAERKSYLDAVQCLRNRIPSLHKGMITGASSRYDDFEIVHINQTFIIHFNAVFMGWHRWFTWTYEQTLRKECGYKGTQPYWDWSLDSDEVEKSPLFDGSPYSMSSNGDAIPHGPLNISINLPPLVPTTISIPSGTGGGCVTKGPFANATVKYGPINVGLRPQDLNNPDNFAYKPHCLKRDLNVRLFQQSASPDAVQALLSAPNVTAFNAIVDYGAKPGVISTHGAGHLGTGGEMADTFSSTGDPIFFFHHAQLDRLWTLWQSRDPVNRQYAVSGTGTAQNYPPSPEWTIEDKINLGLLSPQGPIPFKEIMSTVRGPFCYEYK